MTHSEQREYLTKKLLSERQGCGETTIPEDEQTQKELLRALFNTRAPGEADEDFLQIQDEYLQAETEAKGITDADSLTPAEEGIYLWRGDITALRCDGIVNAANSSMCGCFIPNHRCIDNAIHTYAGIQLRKCCADIMEKQGHDEETGKAKITPAFNLPCRYILHTVGPIIYEKVTEADREQLKSCYRSCLELAEKNGIRTIAFCCISTGVFRFPNREAAEIALDTVRRYRKDAGSRMEVIFNVFKESDEHIYRELLKAD